MPTKKLSPTQNPAVTVSKLSVQYPGSSERAVEDVSFKLYPGTISILVGPNGSGKSTVIKSLLGTIKFSGVIEILTPPSPIDEARGVPKSVNHQLGYLPQRFEFDRSLPLQVEEFLQLSLITCSHSEKTKQLMIKRVLGQVGAELLLKAQLGKLSGGQLQRVLLARALVHQPQLLILDEPEAGIDNDGELQLYQLLRHLATSHQYTVLIASHELQLLSVYADQVLCINKRVICQGKPEQVLKAAVFKELYGSHQQLYTHRHSMGVDHVH